MERAAVAAEGRFFADGEKAMGSGLGRVFVGGEGNDDGSGRLRDVCIRTDIVLVGSLATHSCGAGEGDALPVDSLIGVLATHQSAAIRQAKANNSHPRLDCIPSVSSLSSLFRSSLFRSSLSICSPCSLRSRTRLFPYGLTNTLPSTSLARLNPPPKSPSPARSAIGSTLGTGTAICFLNVREEYDADSPF